MDAINFDKFVYFCKLQLQTGDYDAHIPFWRNYCQMYPNTSRILAGMFYMAWYNEASAHVALQAPFSVPDLIALNLPIETQRRNLHGGRLRQHLEDILLLELISDIDSWTELLARLEQIYGNGRWASYTTAELLVSLLEMNLAPTSFEILGSSGPRKGLIDLALPPTEDSARLVHDELCTYDMQLNYSQLESLLCDWHGMCKGTFYAGRNIDRQQGRILKVEKLLSRKLPEPWRVREVSFPPFSRGEVMGWVGIDKDRLKVYRDECVVLAPWEER